MQTNASKRGAPPFTVKQRVGDIAIAPGVYERKRGASPETDIQSDRSIGAQLPLGHNAGGTTNSGTLQLVLGFETGNVVGTAKSVVESLQTCESFLGRLSEKKEVGAQGTTQRIGEVHALQKVHEGQRDVGSVLPECKQGGLREGISGGIAEGKDEVDGGTLGTCATSKVLDERDMSTWEWITGSRTPKVVAVAAPKVVATYVNDSEGSWYCFSCPWCRQHGVENKCIVKESEINCRRMIHGVIKLTGQMVPAHSSQKACEQIIKNRTAWGCCKSLVLNADNTVDAMPWES